MLFIKGRHCSEDYEEKPLTTITSIWKVDREGQMDVSAIPLLNYHVQLYRTQWFTQNQVTIIDWLDLSFDINPIEKICRSNLKSYLLNIIKYAKVQDLKVQFERRWFFLSQNFFKLLFSVCLIQFFKWSK